MGLLDPPDVHEAKRTIRLGAASVPINQAGITFDACIPFPVGLSGKVGHPSWLVVEDCQVFARGVVATASVDVKKGGTSLLNAPVTPVAGTVVSAALVAALATKRFLPGDQLNLVVTTNGTGTLTDLDVQVTVRTDYASS